MEEKSLGHKLHECYIATFWNKGDSSTHFTWERLPEYTQRKWEEMANMFMEEVGHEDS